MPLMKWRKLLASVALIGLPLYSLSGFSNGYSLIGMEEARADAANSSVTTVTDEITGQAHAFAKQIAAQPQFAGWENAELTITALGPGMHSWLVLVKKQKTIIGYMVLNATEAGGFQLGEYGISSEPLFGGDSLQHSMLQLGLDQGADNVNMERIYIHPLLAAWKISSGNADFYTDAASGEQLPTTNKSWAAASKAEEAQGALYQANVEHKVQKSHSLPSFDPFAKLPWMTSKPLAINPVKYSSLLVKINGQQQLRYVAERFDGQMLYAWSVVGYHNWTSGHPYIALEADETSGLRRFIPLQLLLGLGSFYS
ncbi:hypothetical protein [Paenibacillus harenae]|uniref:hypothetical protein n=1 Tax=Paenibacillus harenae TaxID=306543 RepID=UPI0027D895B4|nr:hypothetical protein [Paenibacillus harenae]